MPRPKKDYDRVIGVYGRTVISYNAREGRRIVETMASEGEAQARAEVLTRLFAREALTVAGAAQEWLCAKDCAEISRDAMRVKLGSFLEGLFSLSPEEVTPALCRERYAQLVKRYAVSTHHARLQVAQEFFAWCVVKGYAKSNPAATIKPEGTPNRGKAQLTLDEARLLAGVLCDEIDQRGRHREHALIILSCLYLGTRVSEVRDRQVRDLDDRGTVLRIPHGKSKNAVRRLRLPEELQRYWKEQAQSKLPTARLFAVQCRTAITNWTYAFCEKAGVPGVCPHSFRGLHATLEMSDGAELSVVARGLGNTPRVSQRHYVQAGTMEQARTDRAVAHLRAPKNDSI